jgi:phage terminase large subunit-like protein
VPPKLLDRDDDPEPRVGAITIAPGSHFSRLLTREGKDMVVTRGTTQENAANLAPAFIAEIMSRYAGTRLGRQEPDAEMLEDTPGALWNREVIERGRIEGTPQLTRIIVAIDPAATSGEDADQTGIVVCGVDGNGRVYVLDDLSGRYPPTDWARIAIGAYRRRQADRIVAEVNNGGEMVEATIRSVDPSVSFKAVHASRGKVTRAEPISALYEQNRVHRVGAFPGLEDQMCIFAAGLDRARSDSPDRCDAQVWALTELMLRDSAQGWVEYYAVGLGRDHLGQSRHDGQASRR